MDPLAAPCISRSITWGSQASARERLSDGRAWRVARGGTKSPLYDCKRAVISHFLASQGQSRPNALAPNMQQLWTRPPLLTLRTPPRTDLDFVTPKLSHMLPWGHLASTVSAARWPFGLGRSGKVHTAENGLFLSLNYGAAGPLLITQRQIHGHCKALEGPEGMKYLPAPWVLFHSGNGAGLGE